MTQVLSKIDRQYQNQFRLLRVLSEDCLPIQVQNLQVRSSFQEGFEARSVEVSGPSELEVFQLWPVDV